MRQALRAVSVAVLCSGCVVYESRIDEVEVGSRTLLSSTEEVVAGSEQVVWELGLQSSGDRDQLHLERVELQDVRFVSTYETESVEIRTSTSRAPALTLFFMPLKDAHQVDHGGYWLFPYTTTMLVEVWDVAPVLYVPPVIAFGPLLYAVTDLALDVITLPYHAINVMLDSWNSSTTKEEQDVRTESREVDRRDDTARLTELVLHNAAGVSLAQGDGLDELALLPLLSLAGGAETLRLTGRYDEQDVALKLALSTSDIARLRQRAGYGGSTSQTTLVPRAEVQLLEGEAVVAGQPAMLRVRVRNVGKGPLQGLKARLRSREPGAEGLVLHVGRVEVGETREVALSVRLDERRASGPFTGTLQFEEANGWAPEDLSLRVDVAEAPLPRLVARWEVVDDGSGLSVGNGDGRVQPGEAIDLVCTLVNDGEVAARDVQAWIDGAQSDLVFGDAVFLMRLGAGEAEELRLHVQVRPSFDDDQLELVLHLSDRQNGDVPESVTISLRDVASRPDR